MKVCMVTAYPPNKGGLAEYGWYMANEFGKNQSIESFTVLANKPAVTGSALKDGPNVIRCWKSDDLTAPISILREIRRINPDVVYFNLHLLSWGESKLCNFLCHMTPFLAKILTRSKVVVTLHNIGEGVDIRHIDFVTNSMVNRVGIFAVTSLLLQADVAVVTLKSYVKTLKRKYRKANITYIPHGMPEIEISKAGKKSGVILTFGYWSKSKNLPLLLEAFDAFNKKQKGVRLLVIGESNSKTPHYLNSIRKLYKNRNVKFLGYVPENRLKHFILSSGFVVLPYLAATGSSGVLHWSVAYGKPVIASDIGMFKEVTKDEGVAIKFFESNNKRSLISVIENLFSDRKLCLKMGRKNLSAAKKFSFSNISSKYIKLFEKLATDR